MPRDMAAEIVPQQRSLQRGANLCRLETSLLLKAKDLSSFLIAGVSIRKIRRQKSEGTRNHRQHPVWSISSRYRLSKSARGTPGARGENAAIVIVARF